ncbi:MAG: AbrB/MazE/SpoVT family DNA-binding domain-containing protein [Anaerolineae bacterium]|nr:AbrB/MazE/SpoVT family DNA-binding domain-containing protein [Anaerolineae bacterium]
MQAIRTRRQESVLTRKGQITLPKAMRDAFGWKPGTRLAFVHEVDGVKIVSVGRDSLGEALVRRSRGIATRSLTTDEIMRQTRDDD